MLSTKDISNLLLFTPQGVNKWKKEQRPIIVLLEKYFDKEDLDEFLETGKIAKMDNLHLVHTAAEKIVRDFFYTNYANSRKNDEFFTTIFPSYIEHEKQDVENRKKFFQNRKETTEHDERKKEISHKIDTIYARYNKRDLIKFIVETELEINKTTALLEISDLSDFEIHLLVGEYKKFVN